MELLKSHPANTNVSDTERWVSLLGGGGLIAYGIAKRDWAGLALAAIGGSLLYRGTTGHCNVYEALGVSTATDDGRNVSVPYELGIRVDKTVQINKPAAELYQFWRNFENLPKFMKHLESVTVKDDKRSHWVAKAPLGRTVEWDAEVINEVENSIIGWRSLEGADVDNAGSVHFEPAPNGTGTQVRVSLQYNPPAGALGAVIAKLFGEEPNQQVHEDLRRFKQLMETGSIPSIEGQPSGKNATPASNQANKVFDRDKVTNASEESFPASDPPSWTPNELPMR